MNWFNTNKEYFMYLFFGQYCLKVNNFSALWKNFSDFISLKNILNSIPKLRSIQILSFRQKFRKKNKKINFPDAKLVAKILPLILDPRIHIFVTNSTNLQP